jgi:hypothetical protein
MQHFAKASAGHKARITLEFTRTVLVAGTCKWLWHVFLIGQLLEGFDRYAYAVWLPGSRVNRVRSQFKADLKLRFDGQGIGREDCAPGDPTKGILIANEHFLVWRTYTCRCGQLQPTQVKQLMLTSTCNGPTLTHCKLFAFKRVQRVDGHRPFTVYLFLMLCRKLAEVVLVCKTDDHTSSICYHFSCFLSARSWGTWK